MLGSSFLDLGLGVPTSFPSCVGMEVEAPAEGGGGGPGFLLYLEGTLSIFLITLSVICLVAPFQVILGWAHFCLSFWRIYKKHLCLKIQFFLNL